MRLHHKHASTVLEVSALQPRQPQHVHVGGTPSTSTSHQRVHTTNSTGPLRCSVKQRTHSTAAADVPRNDGQSVVFTDAHAEQQPQEDGQNAADSTHKSTNGNGSSSTHSTANNTDNERKLTSHIQNCSSWQQLRALLAVHKGSANAVHAAAAMSSVARSLGKSSSGSSSRQDRRPQQTTAAVLSSQQRTEALHFLNTTLLPLAARAMGSVPHANHTASNNNNNNDNNSSTASSPSSPSAHRANSNTASRNNTNNTSGGLRAREATSMLHALATMRHAPPLPWLTLYLEHVRALLPRYSARDAATTVWALAKVAEVALGRADDEQQAAEGDSSSVNGSSVIVAEKRQAFVNLLRPFVVQLMAHVAGLECDVHGWVHLTNKQQQLSGGLLAACNAQDLANMAMGSLKLATLLLDQDTTSSHASTAPSSLASTAHSTDKTEQASEGSTAHGSDSGSSSIDTNSSHTAKNSSSTQQLHSLLPLWRDSLIAASLPLLDTRACSPHALANIAHGIARMPAATFRGVPAAWAQAFMRACRACAAHSNSQSSSYSNNNSEHSSSSSSSESRNSSNGVPALNNDRNSESSNNRSSSNGIPPHSHSHTHTACNPHSLSMLIGSGVLLLSLPSPPPLAYSDAAGLASYADGSVSQLPAWHAHTDTMKNSDMGSESNTRVSADAQLWACTMVEELHAQVHSLSPEDATTVALVLPQLLHASSSSSEEHDVAFLTDFQASVADRLHTYTPRHLSLLLVSLARLANCTLPTSNTTANDSHTSSTSTQTRSAASNSSNSSSSSSSSNRSTTALANSSRSSEESDVPMLRSPSRLLLQRWCAAAYTCVPHFSALDTTQVLWSLGALHLTPPPPLLHLLLQSLRPQLYTVPPSTLALLMCALAALRFRPPWQWQLDFFQATLTASPSHTRSSVTATPSHTLSSATSANTRGSLGVTLLDLAKLTGSLARLQLRPLPSWCTALLHTLESLLLTEEGTGLSRVDSNGSMSASSNGTHFSNGRASHKRAADPSSALSINLRPSECEALPTLCWALLRLRIQPPPPLLSAMLQAAVHAMPHLHASRASLLVWSLLRLCRNTWWAVSSDTPSQLHRSTKAVHSNTSPQLHHSTTAAAPALSSPQPLHSNTPSPLPHTATQSSTTSAHTPPQNTTQSSTPTSTQAAAVPVHGGELYPPTHTASTQTPSVPTAAQPVVSDGGVLYPPNAYDSSSSSHAVDSNSAPAPAMKQAESSQGEHPLSIDGPATGVSGVQHSSLRERDSGVRRSRRRRRLSVMGHTQAQGVSSSSSGVMSHTPSIAAASASASPSLTVARAAATAAADHHSSLHNSSEQAQSSNGNMSEQLPGVSELPGCVHALLSAYIAATYSNSENHSSSVLSSSGTYSSANSSTNVPSKRDSSSDGRALTMAVTSLAMGVHMLHCLPHPASHSTHHANTPSSLPSLQSHKNDSSSTNNSNNSSNTNSSTHATTNSSITHNRNDATSSARITATQLSMWLSAWLPHHSAWLQQQQHLLLRHRSTHQQLLQNNSTHQQHPQTTNNSSLTSIPQPNSTTNTALTTDNTAHSTLASLLSASSSLARLLPHTLPLTCTTPTSNNDSTPTLTRTTPTSYSSSTPKLTKPKAATSPSLRAHAVTRMQHQLWHRLERQQQQLDDTISHSEVEQQQQQQQQQQSSFSGIDADQGQQQNSAHSAALSAWLSHACDVACHAAVHVELKHMQEQVVLQAQERETAQVRRVLVRGQRQLHAEEQQLHSTHVQAQAQLEQELQLQNVHSTHMQAQAQHQHQHQQQQQSLYRPVMLQQQQKEQSVNRPVLPHQPQLQQQRHQHKMRQLAVQQSRELQALRKRHVQIEAQHMQALRQRQHTQWQAKQRQLAEWHAGRVMSLGLQTTASLTPQADSQHTHASSESSPSTQHLTAVSPPVQPPVSTSLSTPPPPVHGSAAPLLPRPLLLQQLSLLSALVRVRVAVSGVRSTSSSHTHSRTASSSATVGTDTQSESKAADTHTTSSECVQPLAQLVLGHWSARHRQAQRQQQLRQKLRLKQTQQQQQQQQQQAIKQTLEHDQQQQQEAQHEQQTQIQQHVSDSFLISQSQPLSAASPTHALTAPTATQTLSATQTPPSSATTRPQTNTTSRRPARIRLRGAAGRRLAQVHVVRGNKPVETLLLGRALLALAHTNFRERAGVLAQEDGDSANCFAASVLQLCPADVRLLCAELRSIGSSQRMPHRQQLEAAALASLLSKGAVEVMQ